jgi:hypothetical protein
MFDRSRIYQEFIDLASVVQLVQVIAQRVGQGIAELRRSNRDVTGRIEQEVRSLILMDRPVLLSPAGLRGLGLTSPQEAARGRSLAPRSGRKAGRKGSKGRKRK